MVAERVSIVFSVEDYRCSSKDSLQSHLSKVAKVEKQGMNISRTGLQALLSSTKVRVGLAPCPETISEAILKGFIAGFLVGGVGLALFSGKAKSS